MTTTSASRQSIYSPAQIRIGEELNGVPLFKAIASPSALALLTSMMTSSSQSPAVDI